MMGTVTEIGIGMPSFEEWLENDKAVWTSSECWCFFLSPAVWVGFRSVSEKSIGSLPLTFLKFPFACQVGLEPGFLWSESVALFSFYLPLIITRSSSYVSLQKLFRILFEESKHNFLFIRLLSLLFCLTVSDMFI